MEDGIDNDEQPAERNFPSSFTWRSVCTEEFLGALCPALLLGSGDSVRSVIQNYKH